MIWMYISISILAGYCILIIIYAVGWNKYSVSAELGGTPQNKAELKLTEKLLKTDAEKILFSIDDETEPLRVSGYPAKLKYFYSILIPARNEEHNIAACLISILNGSTSNSNFEIIVIDDFSMDETAAIAEKILSEASAGSVFKMADNISASERINSFKKLALSLAINKAKGDYIITTDADCIAGSHWLASLISFIETRHPAFVAAPVSFIPLGKTDTLYRFQSIDFLTMQGITAASRYWKLGPLCNGANLAFSRKAFNEVDGYQGIDQIASGDDMLLMNKIERQFPKEVFYLKNQAAIIKTYAQPSWRDFLNQRIRWSSKSGHYENKILQASLLLVYLLNVALLLNILLGIVFWEQWALLVLGMLVVKTSVELLLVYPTATFFQKRNELIFFPLLQIVHIPYVVVAGLLGMVGSYEWKGRSVK